jgi:fatty-acyl-CoA synthase
MMDIPYLIRRAVATHADQLAVDDGRVARTLGAMVDRAERFANALDGLGVEPGSAVGVLSGNRAEYPEVDIGIALGRRVRVALNARLNVEDFHYALEDAEARVLVYSEEFGSEAEALSRDLGMVAIGLDNDIAEGHSYEDLLAETTPSPINRGGDDEDPAWISYTSGTTGRPRGVVLSHRSVREVGMNLLLELGPRSPGELIVLTQALSHGAGYFVLPWLMSGGGLYVLRKFDPDEVEAVSERPEARTLKIVPAMLPPLLELGRPLSFSTICYGASHISPPILEAALDRFGPVLVQVYGQSEAPVTITCLTKEDHLLEKHRNTAGRPFRSVAVEVRLPDGSVAPVGETGEVTVRGHHLMTRYHGLEEATTAVLRDGWVWTKDMGTKDEHGFITLLGRSDEMIISGGYNLSPREVESAILELPEIAECVALGLPDERWGTAVAAAVQLVEGATATPTDLIAKLKPRLGFRTPRRIVILDAVPRNAYGKVDRRAVTSAFETESE